MIDLDAISLEICLRTRLLKKRLGGFQLPEGRHCHGIIFKHKMEEKNFIHTPKCWAAQGTKVSHAQLEWQ